MKYPTTPRLVLPHSIKPPTFTIKDKTSFTMRTTLLVLTAIAGLATAALKELTVCGTCEAYGNKDVLYHCPDGAEEHCTAFCDVNDYIFKKQACCVSTASPLRICLDD
jgi:hypothetical protein